MKRILLITTGWVFIVLGIAGLFLPVLQGILFLVIGLLILSREYAWARNLLLRFEQRFPEVSRRAHRMARRMRARIRLAMKSKRHATV